MVAHTYGDFTHLQATSTTTAPTFISVSPPQTMSATSLGGTNHRAWQAGGSTSGAFPSFLNGLVRTGLSLNFGARVSA